MPTKNDNNREIEEVKELKRAADIDILGLIEQRVKTIESEGYPTEEVYVPLKEAYVLIYKIKKLQESILPANIDYARENIDQYVEAQKSKIELLQQEVKKQSYKFLIRGFETSVYEEAQEIYNKKIEEKGDKLELKDVFIIQMIATSIDSYIVDNKFIDFKKKTKEERLDFVVSLDIKKQLKILDKAISKMLLTANDFEKAMTALPFS
ncbi:MAG: hypothetical protein LBU04_07110 [Christensenellaceae bacterium]|jgi:hypothetical protein|nr:hypothetical protein [Christensenellaceae bacterium]